MQQFAVGGVSPLALQCMLLIIRAGCAEAGPNSRLLALASPYPDRLGRIRQMAPSADADGVAVAARLAFLGQVRQDCSRFSWRGKSRDL